MAERQTTLVVTARDDATATFTRITGAVSRLGTQAEVLNRGALGRIGGNISRFLGGISNGLKSLGKAAYFGGSVAAIASFASDVRSAGDSVSELSRHYKLSTESLQVWGNLLTSSGGNAQNAAKGMQSLALSMEKAKSGDAELLYVFRQLGISLAELKTMSQQDVLGRMAQAFSDPKNTNELAKQAILVKTMGQDGTYFLDALSQGADVYRDKLADMKADGAIMSPEQLDAAREFERRWSSISTILSGIKMDFGLEAAKALMPLLERLQAFLRDPDQSKGLRESLRNIAQSLPAIGAAVMPIVRGVATVVSWLGTAVTWVRNVFGDAGVAVLAVGAVFYQAFGPVVSLVGSIASGFGGVATAVMTIGAKLVPIVTTVMTFAARAAFIATAAGGIASFVGLIGGGVYLLYQKCEAFRNLVDGLWEKLKSVGSFVGRIFGLGNDEKTSEEKERRPTIGESAAALYPQPASGVAAVPAYDPYAAAKVIRQRDAHAEARVRVEVESKTGTRAVIRDVRKEGRVELNASQGMLMVGGD